MRINEVMLQVDLSKRAIKFYEEQGMLHIARDENGYRNYTEDDMRTLKEISSYRKLGIPLIDIRHILENKDTSFLMDILKKKKFEHERNEQEIKALKQFIETNNIDKLYQSIDYDTISSSIQDAVPGFYGYYFIHHFLPYLQIRIETPYQKVAYQNIIDFWDTSDIRLPISYKLMGWIMYRIYPKKEIHTMVERLDASIQMYVNPNEEQYQKLKKQVLTSVRIKNNIFYKYSISGFAQRAFMKELQDKGYNDIFIPNMISLSPKYKEYHEALVALNNRICNELGLHYDSHYNLIIKK